MSYFYNLSGQKISAYIVNVHDALNFDIDLTIPNVDKYSNNLNYIKYEYLNNENVLCHSNTYRCRLQGINMIDKRNSFNNITYKHDKIAANIEICNIVNYYDGWVDISINKIDKYKRLLVNVYIIVEDDIVQDLTSYLLEKYANIYEKYRVY